MEAETVEYETRVIGVGSLVKALMDQLKVVEHIDNALPYQPDIAATYGTLAQIIILNRLTFQAQPLYKLAEWVEQHGLDVLLGIEPQWVDDDRMGQLLEHLAKNAPAIWTAITKEGARLVKLDLGLVHADTTSIYFEGAYEDKTGQPKQEENAPLLVKGYNKDGQPDKVQFVLSLVTAGRVPLSYTIWNGNQSDDGVYLAEMTRLREAGWTQENMIFMGDRKLCNRETMLGFCHQGQQFLAPHPWTEMAKKAWRETASQLKDQQLQWQAVSYTTKKEAYWAEEKRTRYQVCEIPYQLTDPQRKNAYDVRWVFSHSSAKAELDQRQRAKAIAKGEAVLAKMQGLLGKYEYRTYSKITTTLHQRLGQAKRYFSYELQGQENSREWTLTWQKCEKAIEEEQLFDGITLFCTNVPLEKLSAPEVMVKYKSQGRVEQTIDFIKSPVHIRPMWLHSPTRLAGLTLLIMIAVFMASLIEQAVRNHVAQTGKPVKGLMPDKRDNLAPTARKLLEAFQSYAVVIVKHPDGRREVHWPRLGSVQAQIFSILGLPHSPPTNPLLGGSGK